MTEIFEKGKFETVIGITILRFKNGKIVEDRVGDGVFQREAASS